MEYDKSPPSWLKVGAPVAIIANPYGKKSIDFTTVTKLTKRDIVLEDGTRYRHNTQRSTEYGKTLNEQDFGYSRRSGTGWSSFDYILVYPESSYAIGVKRKVAIENMANRVSSLGTKWEREKTIEHANLLREALANWVALTEEYNSG